MSDKVEALYDVIEKAMRLGGIKVSPAQRRKLAMNSGGSRKPRTYNLERAKLTGVSQKRGSKYKLSAGASFLRPKNVGASLNNSSRTWRQYGPKSGHPDKKFTRLVVGNRRHELDSFARRSGKPSPYKRTLFGGLKRVQKSDADVSKAKAKTLYVYRPVENGEDIITWAKAQGFGSTLSAADLHVTVARSKTPLNWAKLGDDYCAEDPRPNDNPDAPRYADSCVSWSEGGRKQRKIEGGIREVKALGDKGAVVLAFQSPSLTERWAQFIRIGASYEFAGYTPHITITYKGDVDLSKVEPYQGVIVLGEEDWNEVKSGSGVDVPEVVTKAAIDAINDRLAAVEKAQAKPEPVAA